jgi:dipeptidyl-peptidase-3
MKKKYLIGILLTAMIVMSCADKKKTSNSSKVQIGIEKSTNFDYNVEQFADIKVLRYQISGWENLTLKEQKLV